MNKTLIIALASAVMKKHLENNPPLKGVRGRDGKSFSFEKHREEITQLISNFIVTISDDLKLKYEDLAKEEKELLKGPRGQKGVTGKKGRHGKDGRDGEKGSAGRAFNFEDSKDEIKLVVHEFISSIEDNLKLKFSDLNEEDKNNLRGERGRIGIKGEAFVFETHEEAINKIIKEHINDKNEEIYNFTLDIFNKNKHSLKLKFSDLTEANKMELRGPRGQKGQKGKGGLSAYDLWLGDGNSGDKNDYLLSIVGEKGEVGRVGLQGLPGLAGLTGPIGRNGNDGKEGGAAPSIVSIKLVKINKKFYKFEFTFDDGSKISTDRFKMPGKTVVQNVTNMSSSTTSSAGDTAKRLTDTRICDEVISALKLVRAVSSTNIVLAENDTYINSKVLGIALSSGGVGASIDVLLFGKHTDGSFAHALNEPLFLGTNGAITTTAPVVGFSANIGHSFGAGAIFIDIKEQIEL